LVNEIKNMSLKLFNQNLKNLGIYLIKLDDNNGIIRCNNINKDKTMKILKSIKKISKNNIKIITISTSGTIKGLMKKKINLN
jgi:RNase P/RNase MRP subunit POP5